MTLAQASKAAAAAQLEVFGALHEDKDTLILLGPHEPGFWAHFSHSPEYMDGNPDPLDRWSKRVITGLAERLNAAPLFPFGGPPYQPFLSWATASGRAWSSPVGMLVHDQSGLMVSYRGALRFEGHLPLPKASTKPCEGCAEPCRTTCPVDALSPSGYDVAACRSHIATPQGAECLTHGCLARRACPVSQSYERVPEQSGFHMASFLGRK
ncbi:ferredoxin [Alphaproteobacteria bacterium KMM 3653]|uniref:Ferredoxin n=1 Tax=Harenicola maris TaxID=2841044 RepID=A0AAP2G2F2_9RHOB|nr:ferredoxin [Harenicola maris]